MPGSRAGHLRSVIRNDHTVEVVALENGQNADHVHIAFVDEGLSIVGHLPRNIPKMQVGDLSLPAVAVDSVVNVPFRHFSESSHAELQCVAAAWDQIKQALVNVWLMDQTRFAAHGWQWRIVG